jgi:hypothetical protein
VNPSISAASVPTYAVVIKCTNCSTLTAVNVPKGVTVQDYAQTRPCPNCGCKTMRPKWTREE